MINSLPPAFYYFSLIFFVQLEMLCAFVDPEKYVSIIYMR